jgi:streptomycin 6-kinase
MSCLPFEMEFIDRFPNLEAWMAELPTIVSGTLAEFQLVAGVPYSGGVSGSVMRVTRSDDTPAVLKLGFPHREGVWEAVGLEAFPPGLGPVVLRQEPATWAMLLEAVEPAVPLRDCAIPEEDALVIAGALHRRMRAANPAPGIPTLRTAWMPDFEVADERVHASTDVLADLGVLDLVTNAVGSLRDLVDSTATSTLLHGDFNPGNILSGSAESHNANAWKLIDPKPMIGDPAYDLWPLVSQVGNPFDSAHHLGRNIDIAADAAGVDAARVRNWGFGLAGINLAWEPDEADAAALRLWAELRG